MKKVLKITSGHVTQEYDPETKQCIGQCFTAGDLVEWEDENGKPITPLDSEFYQPFGMEQPETKKDPNEILARIAGALEAGNEGQARLAAHDLADWLSKFNGDGSPIWANYPTATAFWSKLSKANEFVHRCGPQCGPSSPRPSSPRPSSHVGGSEQQARIAEAGPYPGEEQ